MKPERSRRHRTPAPWRALLVVMVLGCAGAVRQPPAVNVGGPLSAVTSLAGKWRGEYSSAVTQRSGAIRFELAADGVTAVGDVVMTVATDPTRQPDGGSATVLTPLRIHLVQVDDAGTVAGALEPYRDPVCNCMLSTSFVGHWDGDRISGHFVTNGGPGHPATSGRWRVDRQGPAEPNAPGPPIP